MPWVIKELAEIGDPTLLIVNSLTTLPLSIYLYRLLFVVLRLYSQICRTAWAYYSGSPTIRTFTPRLPLLTSPVKQSRVLSTSRSRSVS